MAENAPTNTLTDWNTLCRKADPDMDKPEIVYEFSNKTKRVSTDRQETGVYRR